MADSAYDYSRAVVRIVRSIMILVVCVYSVHACAWGQMGHRVVAEIAANHLTPQASEQIYRLTHGHSLAELSTWLDEVRSDKAATAYASWHFMTWPADGRLDTMPHPPQGDIITSFHTAQATLQRSTDPQQRQEALAILIHLVGDAHQPLHVNQGDDRGGNTCMVGWFSKHRRIRLHKIWDSVMLNSLGLSYTELAHFLDHSTVDEIASIQASSMEDWLRESHALHAAIYPDSAVWHSYCMKKNSDSIPVLSYRYIYEQKPIMEKRLLQGGLRLAGVLNQLFK